MSKSRKPEAYIEQIGRHFLFRGILQEELLPMLSFPGVSVLYFAKGETIYAPDDFMRSLGIILSGKASVRKQQNGVCMLMSVLKSDELFGAATMFTDADEFVVNITAEQPVWALMITEHALVNMMRNNFSIAENYMRYLTTRIRFLSERIDGFVQPGCEERTLLYIRQHAQAGTFYMEIGATAMAEALCMSRASLYRVLDELASKNLIQRSGKTIALPEGDKK